MLFATALQSLITELAMFPLVILGTQLCPTGIEASAFGCMMALFNLGFTISNLIGGLVMHMLGITSIHFNHIGIFVGICGVSMLIPLLFQHVLLPPLPLDAVWKTSDELTQVRLSREHHDHDDRGYQHTSEPRARDDNVSDVHTPGSESVDPFA